MSATEIVSPVQKSAEPIFKVGDSFKLKKGSDKKEYLVSYIEEGIIYGKPKNVKGMRKGFFPYEIMKSEVKSEKVEPPTEWEGQAEIF